MLGIKWEEKKTKIHLLKSVYQSESKGRVDYAAVDALRY